MTDPFDKRKFYGGYVWQVWASAALVIAAIALLLIDSFVRWIF